jgi:hypothetical protein
MLTNAFRHPLKWRLRPRSRNERSNLANLDVDYLAFIRASRSVKESIVKLVKRFITRPEFFYPLQFKLIAERDIFYSYAADTKMRLGEYCCSQDKLNLFPPTVRVMVNLNA